MSVCKLFKKTKRKKDYVSISISKKSIPFHLLVNILFSVQGFRQFHNNNK